MAHPLVAAGQAQVAWGLGLIAVGGGVALAMGGLAGAATFAFVSAAGGLWIWSGRQTQVTGTAMPLLQETLIQLTNGDLDASERATAALPAAIARRPDYVRLLRSRHALIALVRGDATKADELATESLASGPGGLLTRDWVTQLTAEALAIRAFARAATGNAIGAEEDARAVDAIEVAAPSAVARASLARALVLARGSDRSALAEHLRRYGSLILENVLPRERSLARALRALAGSEGRSVYREPVRPDEDASETGKVRAWIGRIAPDAAAYAPRDVFVDATFPPPRADAAALQSIQASRAIAAQPDRQRVRRVVVAVVGLLLVALWALNDGGHDAPSFGEVLTPAIVVAAAGIFLSFLVALRSARRRQRAVAACARAVALGRDEDVTAKLRGLTRLRRAPLTAAAARHQLAVIANRGGRFLDAIAEADAGLALVSRSPSQGAYASDTTTPGLLSERALALAATDRFAEAETELAQLTHAHARYTLLGQAAFRVRLVTAVRRGDDALAARLALTRRPDLPLDLKTELLADVVLMRHGDLRPDERERIAAELRAMPETAAWVEHVMPAE